MAGFSFYGINNPNILNLELKYGLSLVNLDSETKRDLMFCLLSIHSPIPDEISDPGDLEPDFLHLKYVSEEEALLIVKAIANTM